MNRLQKRETKDAKNNYIKANPVQFIINITIYEECNLLGCGAV
jgi:hypothetical protein